MRFSIGTIRTAVTVHQPRDRRHDPVRPDRSQLANGVVAIIRHKDVVGVVDCQAGRIIKPRIAIGTVRCPVVIGESGDGGHDPVGPDWCELPNGGSPIISHINIANTVHRNSGRRIKQGITVCPVGTAGHPSRSGNRRYDPVGPSRCQLPNGGVIPVGHENIASTVNGCSRWIGKSGSLVGPIRKAIRPGKSGNGGPLIDLTWNKWADIKQGGGSGTVKIADGEADCSDGRRVGQDKYSRIDRGVGGRQTAVRCVGDRCTSRGTRQRDRHHVEKEATQRRKGRGRGNRNGKDSKIGHRDRAGGVTRGKADCFHGGGIG